MNYSLRQFYTYNITEDNFSVTEYIYRLARPEEQLRPDSGPTWNTMVQFLVTIDQEALCCHPVVSMWVSSVML